MCAEGFFGSARRTFPMGFSYGICESPVSDHNAEQTLNILGLSGFFVDPFYYLESYSSKREWTGDYRHSEAAVLEQKQCNHRNYPFHITSHNYHV